MAPIMYNRFRQYYKESAAQPGNAEQNYIRYLNEAATKWMDLFEYDRGSILSDEVDIIMAKVPTLTKIVRQIITNWCVVYQSAAPETPLPHINIEDHELINTFIVDLSVRIQRDPQIIINVSRQDECLYTIRRCIAESIQRLVPVTKIIETCFSKFPRVPQITTGNAPAIINNTDDTYHDAPPTSTDTVSGKDDVVHDPNVDNNGEPIEPTRGLDTLVSKHTGSAVHADDEPSIVEPHETEHFVPISTSEIPVDENPVDQDDPYGLNEAFDG